VLSASSSPFLLLTREGVGISTVDVAVLDGGAPDVVE